MTDSFAGPAPVTSQRPTVASLRGRLVMLTPVRQDTVPNKLGQQGSMQEQMTTDITVVDGLGPVPVMKGNPPVPTGQMLDGPMWAGVWITNEVVVDQLRDALAAKGTPNGTVLGRIDTKNPGTNPGKGNAWGIIAPTEEDKNIARAFLANRMVSGASAPAPAPVAQPQPAPQPAPAAYQPPPVAAPAGNPFAASAPAQQTPGVNPFAPKP